AAIPALFVSFRGPQRPFASGAAAVLVSLSFGCLAHAHADRIPEAWLAPLCALAPAAFVIAGSFRMKHDQGAPWVSIGSAGALVAVALSLDNGFASVAAATAIAAIPAMLLAFSGPQREVASAAGALLLSVSAGCLAHALRIPAPWLAASCALVPAAFTLIGRARLGEPQSWSWLGAGAVGLLGAVALGTVNGNSLEFAFVVTVASVPAFVLSCYGPKREESAAAFGVLACVASAFFAWNLHLPAAWFPVACAAVPAALVALGAWAHFLPQGRPWAATGGLALGVALAHSLYFGPLSFAVTALICAAAAGSAIRFAPATLSGVAAFCFNASVVSFMVHAGLGAEVAAPLLATLAALEALAASMAGARTSAHAVFSAAAALVFGAVVWAFAGPSGFEPNLIPGMIALGIAGGTAVLLGLVRRQPYLWAIAGCCAVAEFYLTLSHFHVTTLEAFTFPPAILLLTWAHFAARRKATVVESGPRGPLVEAVLSDWARRLAATVHEQLGSVRLLAVAASVGVTVLLSLPPAERAHLPYALAGSGAVLVAGVLARRKKEAVAGIAGLGSLVAIKAIQWMLERDLSAAWWILVVGGSLLTFVAVFEIRRSWYLKGKGEAVRKVVEAYLSKWR
ncbi:MAG: hypothetical protein K8T20_14335, partial [Planctomycetes bacterium]|nr:hypothetical protein [Planctomycetota bacterium]